MRLATLLALSGCLRLALIAYGEAQDVLLAVPYTDIDYSVFTDAARFVAAGQSPFQRATYRYSPLLAYLLLPNVLLARVWGKLVFAGADILAAWQIAAIGALQGASPARCFWGAVAWLYNPFTATISTRGSCDSLIIVLLLAVLAALLRGRWVAAALLYGLAVHFRIYPIIYAPAIVLFLARRQLVDQQQQGAGSKQARPAAGAAAWLAAVLRQGLAFGCVSGGAFFALGGGFYLLYGQPFLHEAFLHHLVRKDPRHSFSPYYYPVYLSFMDWPQAAVPAAAAAAGVGAAAAAGAAAAGGGAAAGCGAVAQLAAALRRLPAVDAGRLAFAPQAGLLLVLAAALHAELPLCWLLQTMAFVSLNKVVTAQYFVWFLSLLPVALQRLPWPPPRALVASAAAWVAAQLHWLAWGYMLEFKGAGVHLVLWGAGLLFLAANGAVMWALLDAAQQQQPVVPSPGKQQPHQARLQRGSAKQRGAAAVKQQ